MRGMLVLIGVMMNVVCLLSLLLLSPPALILAPDGVEDSPDVPGKIKPSILRRAKRVALRLDLMS